MSEQAGVLDGIRDIIPPLTPVPAQWSGYLMIFIALVLILVLFWIWHGYTQRPRVYAKTLYRQLKKNWSDLSPRSCGEDIMTILRLGLGQQSLHRNTPRLIDIPLDDEQWEFLLAQCHRLRYSNGGGKAVDANDILPMISEILWPSR